MEKINKDNIVIMSRYVEGGADYRSKKEFSQAKLLIYYAD